MNSFSQFGEDLWILENLKPPVGSFCDVGAYDGVESSNTKLFEELGWRGVCIEPHPESWAKCVKNRPQSFCVCAAMDRLSQGIGSFYINPAPGLSSLHPASGSRYPAQITTVRSLWVPIGRGRMNLLSIDTEGTELDVWEGVKPITPDIVIVEFWTQPNPPVPDPIVRQFRKDGYREVHRTTANIIFVYENTATAAH